MIKTRRMALLIFLFSLFLVGGGITFAFHQSVKQTSSEYKLANKPKAANSPPSNTTPSVSKNSAPSSPQKTPQTDTSAPTSHNPSETPPPPSPPPPAPHTSSWNQIFKEDFNVDSPLGNGFPGSAYSGNWGTYGNVLDTNKQVYYDNAKSVSVHGGILDIYAHTEGTEHICAQMTPRIGSAAISQVYGRYVVRYRADIFTGYGGVWLLFPSDHVWPGHGEIDFPEGGFAGTMQANAHYADAAGGKQNFDTHVPYGDWHTAEIDWTPGKEVFLLDGATIGTSTNEVPQTPLFFSFQCGAASNVAPPDSSNGHIQVDNVTIYSYVP